jgi:hypothetical protein
VLHRWISAPIDPPDNLARSWTYNFVSFLLYNCRSNITKTTMENTMPSQNSRLRIHVPSNIWETKFRLHPSVIMTKNDWALNSIIARYPQSNFLRNMEFLKELRTYKAKVVKGFRKSAGRPALLGEIAKEEIQIDLSGKQYQIIRRISTSSTRKSC